jgi:pimeloyl-ACP methyl ester carboxylesterase
MKFDYAAGSGGRVHSGIVRLVLSCVAAGYCVILCPGCASLPAGEIDEVRASSDSPRAGQVYLIRGWNGLWSEGLDSLAAELRSHGLDARVYQQGQARELGGALLTRYRASSRADPLVLVGFSFGADEAIRIARRLEEARVPVALLITLDPVTPPPVPGNVLCGRNFYQSNGVWDALPWLRGVPVKPQKADADADPGAGAARLANFNLRERADLSEGATGHHTIAANRKVREAIVQEVLRACPVRRDNASR